MRGERGLGGWGGDGGGRGTGVGYDPAFGAGL